MRGGYIDECAIGQFKTFVRCVESGGCHIERGAGSGQSALLCQEASGGVVKIGCPECPGPDLVEWLYWTTE